MNTPKEILIITGAGAAAFSWAEWQILRASRARRWPQTTATIVESAVVNADPNGDGQRMRIEIAYEYAVKGQTYRSDRLAFYNPASRRGAVIEQRRKRYRQGARIKVHYNPGDPRQAVVETDLPRAYSFIALFGLIFLSGGLFAALTK